MVNIKEYAAETPLECKPLRLQDDLTAATACAYSRIGWNNDALAGKI
jgi:hypothetical protein